jgi:suppressor of ftsI
MRGLVVTVALGLAVLAGPARSGVKEGPPFQDPPFVASVDGVLETELAAGPSLIEVGGQAALTNVYNGQYIPPTLVVNRGDQVRLQLVNGLQEMTNLHYHGFNGSPMPPGDDVFIHVEPGETFPYEFTVPQNQSQGLHWYHPHMHGLVEPQILGGMSGAYIVNGLLDPFPQLQGITEHVLLLKDIQIVDGQVPQSNIDIGAPSIRTVNGLVNPTMTIRPGETQLWRIGNIAADRYYHLRLEGHRFHEIARDGNRHNQLVTTQQLNLPPSSRGEVLIQAGRPGIYRLVALPVSTGPQGDQYDGAELATLVCSGAAQQPVALPRPAQFPRLIDLRDAHIARRRMIVYSETADGDQFFINGKQFDEDTVDTRVRLGTVEEWTILNVTAEAHTFHIHQVDYQVTNVNGKRQPFVGYQDNVNIPYSQSGIPGAVKVLIPFINPRILGKFVYHCHITQHEDAGMMATVEVSQ